MASTYEIDLPRRIVIVTMTGEIGDEDLVEIHNHLRRDETLPSDSALLVDLREAKGAKITSAGVRVLASLPLVLAPEARRAVVVPSNLGLGMTRMYELWRGEEGGRIRAFREFDEARNWVASDHVQRQQR